MRPIMLATEIRSLHLCLMSALILQPVFSKQCSKTTLDDCLNPLFPLMEDPLVRGIPQSKEAVDKSCTAFKKGMVCVDAAALCMSERQRQELQRQVAGARNTFAFLCDDEAFQKEFLQHQACYRGISSDWHRCATRFQSFIASDQEMMDLTQEEHELGQCCAKMGFLNCIFDKVRFLCRSDSSLFVMRVAQTLANIQINSDNCRNITEAVCSSSKILSSFLLIASVLFVITNIFS